MCLPYVLPTSAEVPQRRAVSYTYVQRFGIPVLPSVGLEMGLGPGRSLVTGATGFIGRQLVSSLLADGESVRVLSCSDVGDAGLQGLEAIQGDLTRPDSLRGVASGCGTIFHCAGFAHALKKSLRVPM